MVPGARAGAHRLVVHGGGPARHLGGRAISGALLELHGLGGLKGWHWLFVVEGLPAILLGIAAYFFLDDKPEQARWLSGEERAALSRVLADEAEATRDAATTRSAMR